MPLSAELWQYGGPSETLLQLGERRSVARLLSPAFLDHFGLADVGDLPGMDDLKAAGLLRKGQILGALMDNAPQNDDLDDEDDSDANFLEYGLLDAGYDGEEHA